MCIRNIMQRITILLCKFFIQYPQFLFYWDTRLSPSFSIMKAETAHQTLSDEMRNDSWKARNRNECWKSFSGDCAAKIYPYKNWPRSTVCLLRASAARSTTSRPFWPTTGSSSAIRNCSIPIVTNATACGWTSF